MGTSESYMIFRKEIGWTVGPPIWDWVKDSLYTCPYCVPTSSFRSYVRRTVPVPSLFTENLRSLRLQGRRHRGHWFPNKRLPGPLVNS